MKNSQANVAAPMTQRKAFDHSTPELYDRYMGPLLFEPFTDIQLETVGLSSRVDASVAAQGLVLSSPRRFVRGIARTRRSQRMP